MNQSERLERIDLLKRKAKILQQDLHDTPSAELLQEYGDLLAELERVQRIEAGYQDIMVFAQTYFQGTPPHDLLKPETPSPKFHFELAALLRESVLDPGERKTAIVAPRSHAKSTMVTNIFPLWCIAYADDLYDRYWVIIGDKQDNARKFLDVIKDEIEDNELFIADFGRLKGDTWNAYEIITANKVKISAHGAGEGLRGLKYGSFRPSVIMDDIESDESCSTPDRIEKMVSWFNRTVLPLGDPNRSKFFLVGTIIHYDSLLSQVVNKRADWDTLKYKAIPHFPDRMDLWNEWEDIYHDRTLGDDQSEAARIARDRAMKFYGEHREDMNEGAVVLWPERMPLIKLMEIRANNRMSFNSEYQNDPVDEHSRIFHTIRFYTVHEVDPSSTGLRIFGACDPSMGQTKRSDPSAIITLGMDRRGIMYVLDIDMKRRHPDEIIRAIFQKAKMYKYTAFAIEAVAFQQFMKDELIKRSAEQGIYLPVREFKSKVKKEMRIASLEPDISNGYIRLLPSQRDLIEQLEYFPKASHDDAPDVLSMVVELAKTGGRMVFGKI